MLKVKWNTKTVLVQYLDSLESSHLKYSLELDLLRWQTRGLWFKPLSLLMCGIHPFNVCIRLSSNVPVCTSWCAPIQNSCNPSLQHHDPTRELMSLQCYQNLFGLRYCHSLTENVSYSCPRRRHSNSIFISIILCSSFPVSYTHLTLPTN